MKSDCTNQSHQGQKGFSLVELLIVIALLSVLMSITGQILVQVQGGYVSQNELMEAQNYAMATMDTLARLIRQAGNDPQRIDFVPIDPDPDGNGEWDSIHIRSDWNPPDGLLDDPNEDIVFSTQNGTLFVEESGQVPTEFLDGIESVTFSYFDRDNNPITDPAVTPDSIAHIRFDLEIQPEGSPSRTFSSGITIRTRE